MSKDSYERGRSGDPYVRSIGDSAFGPFVTPKEDVEDYKEGQKDRVKDKYDSKK